MQIHADIFPSLLPHLFTEMQVGNAEPFSRALPLKILLHSLHTR